MIKNLIKIAYRNLIKDKWFSLMNVLGLTIGITFSLFLIFYIKDELSFDRYHLNADQVYRLVSYIKEPEKNNDWTSTQMPLGPTLKKDYPEVEESLRLLDRERTLFKFGSTSYFEDKLYYSDSTIFKLFTYKFLEGNPDKALTLPNSIVITKSLALKYFGKSESAIGKTLQTPNDEIYKVTAVIEDIPKNSHITFNALLSMTSLPKANNDNWGNFSNYTYVLLKKNTDAKAFETKLLGMYQKYMAAIFAQFNIKIRYGVMPITQIHLHSEFKGEPEELGSMSYIWIFSAVAFFMILIACINYMNLTTARSARRAKEIGIRKVTGSSRQQLISQFLGESLMTAFIALLLSIGLVILLLPAFNSLSGKFFTLQTLLQPSNVLLVIVIVFMTGLLGGSYPAFYLSGFKPVSILKGALSKASGNVNLRRTLVVIQFSIAMIMLICTWVVFQQLSYLRNKDLGFDKAQMMTVIVNTGKDERPKISALTNALRGLSDVKAVGTGYSFPGNSNSMNLFSVETDKGYLDKGIEFYGIDQHYLSTLNIPVIQGKNFIGLIDTLHGAIVNEAMVKNFGWSNPIGKRIKQASDTSNNYFEVVGVVKDFNQKSLYNPITPLILLYSNDCNNLQIKLTPNNMPKAISQVEKIWKQFFPQLPFEYKFLDQDFDSQYEADQKRGRIFATFSILTIIITCLGLLGLTAFTTQQKQKEISIRRVMGASVIQVVNMIVKSYFWLALVAALIAFPVAYYFMNQWLQVFPFNAGLSVLPFVVSAFFILLTALLTATYHSAKAALAKPANNLRTE
jgi:putative ABC transport system permease protein